MSDSVYMIRDWEKHFETAKSMQIKKKSQAEIPVKQGLSYRRMLTSDPLKGPAMYGCFVAIICYVSSRTREVRNGYLTQNGEKDGVPLTVDDLSVILFMDKGLIEDTLNYCTSLSDPWIVTYDSKYLSGTCQVLGKVNSSTLCSSVQESSVPPIVPQGGTVEPDLALDGGVAHPGPKRRSKWTRQQLEEADYAAYPNFEKWWYHYPNGSGKRKAFESWVKQNLEFEDLEELKASIKAHLALKQWQDEDGKYIPLGATFLNQRQFEDELSGKKITAQSQPARPRFAHG